MLRIHNRVGGGEKRNKPDSSWCRLSRRRGGHQKQQRWYWGQECCDTSDCQHWDASSSRPSFCRTLLYASLDPIFLSKQIWRPTYFSTKTTENNLLEFWRMVVRRARATPCTTAVVATSYQRIVWMKDRWQCELKV